MLEDVLPVNVGVRFAESRDIFSRNILHARIQRRSARSIGNEDVMLISMEIACDPEAQVLH